MSEQQSQKPGLKSDNLKRAASHREFEPTPPSKQVVGAHAKRAAHRESDEDISLRKSTKRPKAP